jgi:serine/threonine protein kinase
MEGYNIAIPEYAVLRGLYINKLKDVIQCIHEIGVVHLDLYPSNILWKAIDE